MPYKKHLSDAGWDLYAAEDVVTGPDPVKIRTGTSMAIPTGLYGKIEDRSSMAARGVKTCGGVIDSSYRGEIIVLAYAVGMPVEIARGERIAQLVIHQFYPGEMMQVESLDETVRGRGGFGSTGLA